MIIEEQVSLDRLSVQAHTDMQGNIHAITPKIDGNKVEIHNLKAEDTQSVEWLLCLYFQEYKLRQKKNEINGITRMYEEHNISLYMEYSFI